MSDLLHRVAENIRAGDLLRRRQAILVAVSGGLDSMVLLHLLARLSKEHAWRLTVAHFNHQLRGRSSDADERHVGNAALKLGLPFVSGRADVRKHSRENGVSIEMAARKLRHAFLARTAVEGEIATIALAHHADDQVELFFVRLLRGAGSDGLGGMKWMGPSPENARIKLVRPLLDVSRQELSDWATRENILFREDSSNARIDIQRNRIRHELIPLLTKHYQKSLSRIVLRLADILGAEGAFVEQAARQWLKSKRRPTFDSLPVALQRKCMQLQLAQNKVVVNYELIEQIRTAANRPVTVNARLGVFRDNSGSVHLRHLGNVNGADFNGAILVCKLQGRAGEISFENAAFAWKISGGDSGTFRAPKRAAKSGMKCETFDADKVGSTMVLRHWRPGDRFQPIGMGKPVKLQDLFTNGKILPAERRRLIVGATAGGEIFWVEGLRMGERFKLDRATSRRLQWRWKRL